MLHTQIVLPGSLENGLPRHECSRCGNKRQRNDGVQMGSKFVCGGCWRSQAVKKKSASGKKK